MGRKTSAAADEGRASGAPEEELRELLRERGERLEVLEPGRAALGVGRAERRRDDLLQEARRRGPRAGPERPQVARLDAVARQARAGLDDVHVALG